MFNHRLTITVKASPVPSMAERMAQQQEHDILTGIVRLYIWDSARGKTESVYAVQHSDAVPPLTI